MPQRGALCQEATAWQVRAPHAGMGWQERRVGSKVSRTPGVGLTIDTPGLLIQAERLESAGPAKILHLVYDLVATVVPRTGLPPGMLVGKC